VQCHEISAAWGAQRINDLNMRKALWDIVQKLFKFKKNVNQKKTETSLISHFLYPKHGPGQMWEAVAKRVTRGGGNVVTGVTVDVLRFEKKGKVIVETERTDGVRQEYVADAVFSTMPVQELIRAIDVKIPNDIEEISEGLQYRDFITVGLLVRKLKVTEKDGSALKDNWIYIQEPDVKVGRMQIFNNWSEYMVNDPDNTVWLGLEYFCDEGDELWQLNDKDMISLAKDELVKMGIIIKSDVLDATVIHVPKAYPAYFGTYDRFDELRCWLDKFDSLYLLGRNGMHRYNNQDHSMLTARKAVEHVVNGRGKKGDIWRVNEEKEYHEEK
jgi:protoporphyrinogen oxidase